MEELTNGDFELIVSNYQAVKSRWSGTEFLSIQKYAINQLADTVYPFYIKFMQENNKLIEKHVEFENGEPKFRAQLIDIKAKESPSKEYLFKSEMDKIQYFEGYKKLLAVKSEIYIKKYPITQLLETKAHLNELDIYSLIRFVEE